MQQEFSHFPPYFKTHCRFFFQARLEERVGFEPTDLVSQVKRFRVAPDRPLWHLSVSRTCNRSAAPHLLCHRPGPHTMCIADRPLSHICSTVERLQYQIFPKFWPIRLPINKHSIAIEAAPIFQLSTSPTPPFSREKNPSAEYCSPPPAGPLPRPADG